MLTPPATSKELDNLLRTPSGILRIVDEKWREQDELDFKRTIERRDKKWKDTLRTDCAALAYMGTGYLVIGIDESHDGYDRAEAIAPVLDPSDLKRAIEDTLANGLSPPLLRYEVWPVNTERGTVVVVRVEGKKGYPVEVEALAHSRAFLRRGAKNIPLAPDKARVLREEWLLKEKERAERKRKWFQITALAAVPLAAALGIGTWILQDRSETQKFAVDLNLCGSRPINGIQVISEDSLWGLINNVDSAILRGNAVDCWRLHAHLLKTHPTHVWRYWLRGQCLFLEGKSKDAIEYFAASEELASRAHSQQPSCGHFKFVQLLSAYFAGRQDEACKALHALAKDDPSIPMSGRGPMSMPPVACSGMGRELALLGLGPAFIPATDRTDSRWILNPLEVEPVFRRIAEANVYDVHRCRRAFFSPVERIDFRWRIGRTGDVEDIVAENVAEPDKRLVSCIVHFAADWRFPRHTSERPVYVEFPFVFISSNER